MVNSYEWISFLYDIRIENPPAKSFFHLIVTLINVISFTAYIIWLDKRLEGISFSNTSIVFCTIVIIIILLFIQKKGKALEEKDNKEKDLS